MVLGRVQGDIGKSTDFSELAIANAVARGLPAQSGRGTNPPTIQPSAPSFGDPSRSLNHHGSRFGLNVPVLAAAAPGGDEPEVSREGGSGGTYVPPEVRFKEIADRLNEEAQGLIRGGNFSAAAGNLGIASLVYHLAGRDDEAKRTFDWMIKEARSYIDAIVRQYLGLSELPVSDGIIRALFYNAMGQSFEQDPPDQFFGSTGITREMLPYLKEIAIREAARLLIAEGEELGACELRLRQAQILVDLGRYGEAVRILGDISGILTRNEEWETEAHVHTLEAAAYLELEDYARAARSYLLADAAYMKTGDPKLYNIGAKCVTRAATLIRMAPIYPSRTILQEINQDSPNHISRLFFELAQSSHGPANELLREVGIYQVPSTSWGIPYEVVGLQDGMRLMEQLRFTEAAQDFKHRAQGFKDRNEPKNEAVALTFQAEALFNAREYVQAAQHFVQSGELHERLGHNLLAVVAYQRAGDSTLKGRQYESTLQMYDRAIKLAESHGLQLELAIASRGKGRALYALGRYQQAEAAVRLASEILREIGYAVEEKVLRTVADNHRRLAGRLLFKHYPDPTQLPSSLPSIDLYTLAHALLAERRYGEAVSLFEKVVPLFDAEGKLRRAADAVLSQAFANEKKGDKTTAASLFQDAGERLVLGPNPIDTEKGVEAFLKAANLYGQLNDGRQVAYLCMRAGDTLVDNPDTLREAATLFSKSGAIYHQQGEYDDSFDAYHAAGGAILRYAALEAASQPSALEVAAVYASAAVAFKEGARVLINGIGTGGKYDMASRMRLASTVYVYAYRAVENIPIELRPASRFPLVADDDNTRFAFEFLDAHAMDGTEINALADALRKRLITPN